MMWGEGPSTKDKYKPCSGERNEGDAIGIMHSREVRVLGERGKRGRTR